MTFRGPKPGETWTPEQWHIALHLHWKQCEGDQHTCSWCWVAWRTSNT